MVDRKKANPKTTPLYKNVTIFILFLLILAYLRAKSILIGSNNPFVQVDGLRFVKGGKTHFSTSMNYWLAANLGAVTAQGGNRTRLLHDLDHLKSFGVNNVRIMASSEGPRSEPYRISPALLEEPGMYNLDLFDGLDFTLAEIRKRGMTATLCLSNFWHWSGGLAQFVSWSTNTSIPYPSSWNGTHWTGEPYDSFVEYTAQFYHLPKAKNFYLEHIRNIILRENKYSKVTYKQDPTIFAWELANEPQLPPFDWISNVSSTIKSLDQNHLVTAGHEANQNWTDFNNAHSPSSIDYCTVHIWAQNRGIYNMTDSSEENIANAVIWGLDWVDKANHWAMEVGKPLILAEIGFPRDNWVKSSGDDYLYSQKHPTTRRDRYFKSILERVVELSREESYSGFGVWTYSGEGRIGDVFMGDPPHEPPGWYSLYSTDESTLSIIQEIAAQFE